MKAWEEIPLACVAISKAFLLQIQVSLVDVWKLLGSVVLDVISTNINSKWFDNWPKFMNQWPFNYKADALAIAPRQCRFFCTLEMIVQSVFYGPPQKVIVYNDFRKVSRWWIMPAEAYKSSNWQKETSNSLLWLPWNPLGCHFSLMDVRKNMSTTR